MNSKFSDFFRNATYEEKERLWKEIARKACEEQLEVINQARQMNERKIEFTGSSYPPKRIMCGLCKDVGWSYGEYPITLILDGVIMHCCDKHIEVEENN